MNRLVCLSVQNPSSPPRIWSSWNQASTLTRATVVWGGAALWEQTWLPGAHTRDFLLSFWWRYTIPKEWMVSIRKIPQRVPISGVTWDKETRASSNGATSVLNSRSHWKKYLGVDTWCQVSAVSASSLQIQLTRIMINLLTFRQSTSGILCSSGPSTLSLQARLASCPVHLSSHLYFFGVQWQLLLML